MDFQNRRALKEAAHHALAAAPYDPRKIVWIHTAVMVGASLIGTLINFVLGLQIENTGGLSGIGTRAMLSTAQSFLQVIVAIALPFWEAGFLYATMGFARERRTEPGNLLEGFRRFGPLLRSRLLQMLIYFAVGFATFFISMQIFLLTPLSKRLLEVMETIPMESMLSDTAFVLDEATQIAVLEAYAPMMLIFLAVYSVAMLVVSYNFRMMDYLILDHPGLGAIAAFRLSRVQIRMKKMALFKLDLSFWWFYVLQTLASMLAYADYMLATFGIAVPVSPEVLFLGSLVLSLVCQTALYVLARNQVFTTYAKFYDATALPLQAAPKQPQQNNPWAN